MESITVIPERLEEASEQVKKKTGEYYEAYLNLLREVENLTKTDFQGPAAEEYREKVKAHEKDFNKMKELMEQYASFLNNAAQEYRALDEKMKNEATGM